MEAGVLLCMGSSYHVLEDTQTRIQTCHTKAWLMREQRNTGAAEEPTKWLGTCINIRAGAGAYMLAGIWLKLACVRAPKTWCAWECCGLRGRTL